MKTRAIALGSIFCLVICSCSKDPFGYRRSDPKGIGGGFFVTDTPAIYNYAAILYNSQPYVVDTGYDIVASAGFSDSITGAPNFVQAVYINNTQLPGDSDYFLRYTDSAHLSLGKAFAGRTSTVKIIGSSSADTLDGSVYVPSDIARSLLGISANGLVDFSHAMNLTWVPDARSSELTVIVWLFYFSDSSGNYNHKLPVSLTSQTYVTGDNGSFAIPAGDLKGIPLSTYWGLQIGRYYRGQARLPVSNRRVFLGGVSEATIFPLYVVDSVK